LLGELLTGVGRLDEARSEFRRALARTPGRPLALLGLARTEAAAGRASEATTAYRALLEIWHAADAEWPGVAEARAYVAHSGTGSGEAGGRR
jgi:hypothetical protein